MADSLINQLRSLANQVDCSGCSCPDALIGQLKSLANQVDKGSCCSPCGPCGPCGPCPPCGPCGPCGPCPPCGPPPPSGCPPCPYPYAQVCMLTPPCCVVPTQPKYVKPLQLPMPKNSCSTKKRCPEEDFQNRVANFYNNYNIDYHEGTSKSKTSCPPKKGCRPGVTVAGKNPNCEDYMPKRPSCKEDKGCPTGYKPCQMKLCSPPGCDPLAPWKATIQPCPPKSKKVSTHYVPGECTRPCCKHWKPKGGPCIWPKPCKASCFNHEVGRKACK